MQNKYIEIDEIKKMQVDILREFHRFCTENDIQYYMYAGTLLGAVRHKGFIPWDDDIDLLLPRPDYEKLLKLCKIKNIANHLRLFDDENNEFYPYTFAKICDIRTCCHVTGLDDRIGLGVWIDIFPMDGLPTDENALSAHVEKLHSKIRLLNRCTRKFYFSKNPVRLVKNVGLWVIYGHRNYHKIIRDLKSMAQQYPYEGSKRVGLVVFSPTWSNIAYKEWFDQTVMLSFENYEFNAPGKYIEFLTQLYGENCYCELPPESERVREHDYVIWWKEGWSADGIYSNGRTKKT